MNDKNFDSPVFVMDGQFVIREISCLADALDFLDEWPKKRRGTMYDTLRRALLRAHDGHMPVAAARKAFEQWARFVRVLEEISPVPAWMPEHRPAA